jgi:hypothetical protein
MQQTPTTPATRSQKQLLIYESFNQLNDNTNKKKQMLKSARLSWASPAAGGLRVVYLMVTI